MTLHFVHIGKTGGSAVKDALRSAGLAYWKRGRARRHPVTPYGGIQIHHHRFRLDHVPDDDHAFFFLRDPVARFLSGFESRLTKGQPRYYFEWTEDEAVAFRHFGSALQLAHALASPDEEERRAAEQAMSNIRHLGPMQRHTGPPSELRKRLDQVVYIGRQETLGRDWVQLKELLGLPPELELPTDPVRAHKREQGTAKTELDDEAVRALRRWYAADYKLIDFCEQVRASHGWGGATGRRGLRGLRARLTSARPGG